MLPAFPLTLARPQAISLKIGCSFWMFGLINNIYYVIILTAALDLVGPSIPKATVLLACIVPGLATKLATPYVIHLVPYSARTILLALLSTTGMLAVAMSPDTTDAASVSSKLFGIVVANISSGAGEVNFLSLTHFYGPLSLAAWGSGTGGAGLIGAGAYTLATTTLGFSVHATLLSSTILSVVFLASYFFVLPLEILRTGRRQRIGNQHVTSHERHSSLPDASEAAVLLPEDHPTKPISSVSTTYRGWLVQTVHDMQNKMSRTRSLVVPFMLPLFLVYLAEYSINQGVAPTLLFDLADSPFKEYRAFYPTYGTIYQTGVFISRSSLPFIRIRSLYTPTLLQVLNFMALTSHAIYPFLPNVWFVFAVILWEGLLGGLVYVSTFAAVREQVPEEDREFSLGAVSSSDSCGIFVAGLLGSILEPALCKWQVSHGRDFCRRS